MKKLGIYAAVVAVLVFALWFSTKDGMQPDEKESVPVELVESVTLQSRSFDRRVHVENREDIQRLTDVLNRLNRMNGVWVDKDEAPPENSVNWKLEWISAGGESLAVVEISDRGKVYRGEQLYNFLGGEVYNIEYLTGLLMGLPSDPDPFPTPSPDW